MPINKLIYLGNRIRSARKDCYLTQQELAGQCGFCKITPQMEIQASNSGEIIFQKIAMHFRIAICTYLYPFLHSAAYLSSTVSCCSFSAFIFNSNGLDKSMLKIPIIDFAFTI